ncbi:MAG: hypothetical protein HKL95_04500, partial [Phycisphaerae bacterium]|nr:hypothetical protein [Phycisphaerae bacterium]
PSQMVPYFSVGECQSLVPGIYAGKISYGIGSTVFAPLALHPGPSLNCLFLDFHVESVLSSKFATSVNPYSANCIWSEP